MIDYAFTPAKTDKTTPTAQHVNRHIDFMLLHLFGGNSDPNSKAHKELVLSKAYKPIALHHFKDPLREAVIKSK